MKKVIVQSVNELNYQEDLKLLPSTSSKIRYLSSAGIKRGEIAKMLNIRYQHVRNVLITPLTSKK